MTIKHLVEQGDHISSIAERYGFEDYAPIWEHGDNDELRNNRPNPHVLLPGDVVSVLDPVEKTFTRATGKQHRFVLKVKPLVLRVSVLKVTHDPDKSAPCKVAIEGGAAKSLTTDGDGKVPDQPLARTDKLARLTLNGADFSLKIGWLDPITEPSGWEARLNNLGYAVPPKDDRTEDEVKSAIEEFQCDHGLDVKGEMDDKTRAKLEEIHGS